MELMKRMDDKMRGLGRQFTTFLSGLYDLMSQYSYPLLLVESQGAFGEEAPNEDSPATAWDTYGGIDNIGNARELNILDFGSNSLQG